MAKQKSAGGYLASAAVFAAITALWAYVVRADPYYRFIDLFGVRLPAATIAYLTVMPLLGVLLGRWRFANGERPSFGAKAVARVIQFFYSHSLLVLFTAAMATDYFLGLNIDAQVKSLDDRMFDLAARFAPWLSAYLFGFNLGRATIAPAANAVADDVDALKTRMKAEPLFGEAEAPAPGEAAHEAETPMMQTASGLALEPAADHPPADEQGFLPPQDLARLRPTLDNLR